MTPRIGERGFVLFRQRDPYVKGKTQWDFKSKVTAIQ